jgi:hypothetical protein
MRKTSWRRASATAASASRRFSVNGFSHNTALPAPSANTIEAM